MKNQNPIEALDSIALTKTEIANVANQIAAGVEAGIDEPLELIVKIEFLKKALDEAKKKILPSCLDELDLHDKGGTKIAGVKVEQVESGVKYDYSNCELWKQGDAIVQEATQARKEIETRLKTLKKPESILDEETGEIVQLVPPSRKSTTTVKLTFGK